MVDLTSISPLSALVVEPNEGEMTFLASTLASAGFVVTAAQNFREAREFLLRNPPVLLVTEIRLADYNGLQLALRGASIRPGMAIVVISRFADPVLQRDAEQVPATFALKPLTSRELLAAVFRTALRRPNAEGVVETIRAPFERRQGERRLTGAGIAADRRHEERRRGIAELLRHGVVLM